MRLGRSALGVFVSNALNLVLSFGNSILLTRTLGVVGKGEFAVFSASFGILSLLLGLGLEVSVRYYVAKERVPLERVLTTLALFVLGVGAVIWITVHLNHRFFTNELFLPYSKQTALFEWVLAGVVMANLFYANFTSLFAGRRSFAVLNAMTVGFAAVSLVAYGGLYWAQATGVAPVGSDEVFLVYLGLQILAAVVLGGLAYRKLGVRPSRALLDRALLADLARYGAKVYVANVAQFLNYRIDYWLVQALEGAAPLGLYSLASNLAMMLWMLPRSASTVLLPSMAAGDEGASFEGAARLGRITFGVTVGMAVPLALFARTWIGWLYGTDFAASGDAFRWLLIGCVPFTLCTVQAGALAAVDRLDLNLIGSVVGLVVTVVGDVLLIPRYGIEGAAAASSASYLVTAAIVLVSFARIGKLPLAACVVPTPADVRYVRDGLRGLLG